MASDDLADPFNPSQPAPPSKAPSSPSFLTPTTTAKHRPTLTTLLSTTDLEAATASDLDLPSAPPLGHDVLSGEDFDASDFLLERRHTPLEDLRSELRSYLATLRTSLVGVINEEYEAFIGLSLGLKHAAVSTSLQTIRRPVLSIRGEVTHVKDELEEMRDEMGGVLEERREVREMKALMRRLLATEEAVEKVEGLLKVGEGGEKARQLDLNVDSPAKRLERIASEYQHMRYLVERAGDLPFVHSLQPRMDKLTSALHLDLSNLLSSILASSPSLPSYRSELTITLQIFSTLSRVSHAEDIVRSSVVSPFIKRAIHRDTLADLSSPSLPSDKPHIPPAYCVDAVDSPAAGAGSDSAPLAALYNRVLAFITDECSVLLDVAERVVVGSPASSNAMTKADASSSAAPSSSSGGDSTLEEGHYELLSRCILDPILSTLVSGLGSTIFAAGRPTVFHTNYLLTSSFISRVESLCPSLAHLHSLRAHPTYVALFKRFQLPVYFQLRFKEAVQTVERAFEVGSASGGGSGSGSGSAAQGGGFVMSESEAVYRAVARCWDEEVWLEELGGRFWKLTLQILSRYRTWLNDKVPKYVLPSSASSANLSAMTAGTNPSSRSSFEGDRNRLAASASSTRPSTPSQQQQAASDDVSEEATLRQLTVLIADSRTMEKQVWELWESRITGQVRGDDTAGDILRSSLANLTSVVPSLSSQITTILTKRCAEHLKLVRSVASQVRASTRRGATEPSYFVGNILKELKGYLAGPGRVVEEELRRKWATAVVEEIAGRYAAILSTQKKTEDSLRWLKKGRQGLSFFGRAASSAQQPDESDDDRVKMQMQLDVETLAKDAETLGVDIAGSEAFGGLRRATTGEVAAAQADEGKK
ncbi:hypothetical protein JCM11251_003984 [Rhodosporidiobolus azoricus]